MFVILFIYSFILYKFIFNFQSTSFYGNIHNMTELVCGNQCKLKRDECVERESV